MIIGKYYCDNNEYDICYNNDKNKYFLKLENKEELGPITKEQLSTMIANYWSDDSNHTIVKEQSTDGTISYLATMVIPIYDWISIELFGVGESVGKAKSKVKTLFNNFIEYNNKIEENIERNRINHMKKIQRFCILPQDRKDSALDIQKYYSNMEVYFCNNDDARTYRDIARSLGIPNDGRGDSPIYGYIENGNIVFINRWFTKGEMEIYLQTIKHFLPTIKSHYNLNDNADIYLNAKEYNIEMLDKKEFNEKMVNSDFDYYTIESSPKFNPETLEIINI